MPGATVLGAAAYPSERLAFESVNWVMFTGSDTAPTSITAAGTTDIPNALITGIMPNWKTAAWDHGELQIGFGHPIAITATPPFNMYAPISLSATYAGDKILSKIHWSVDPEANPGYTVVFDQNSSPVSGSPGNQTTTTKMTVYGPNNPVNITVYARSVDQNQSNIVTGISSPIAVQPGIIAQGNVINVVSLDGTPLEERDAAGNVEWHMIQATYMKADGSPIPNWPLTWNANNSNVTLLSSQDSQWDNKTDANGVATNAVSTTNKDTFDFTVTVSADSTSDSGKSDLTFQLNVQPLPGEGSMKIAPVASPVPVGQAQPLTVTYSKDGNPVPNGTVVTWFAAPADRLTFSGGSGTGVSGNVSKVTGGQGQATINVTASQGASIPTAVISTRGLFDSQTGAYDHSDPDLVLSFTGQASDALVVTPENNPPYYLYTATPFDATYGGTDKTFSWVSWSVDESKYPGYTFDFDKNPSPVTGSAGNRTTSTNLTVIGPNQPLNNVTVYAASVDPDPANYISGASKPVTFQSSSAQGTILTITSPDGYVLSEGSEHVLEATYTNLDGSPVTGTAWDGTIVWTVDPANPQVRLLDNDPTKANAQGLATNAVSAVYGPDTITATVKAHAGNMPDTDANNASVTLTFAREIEPVSGQGHMTIIPKDGYVLTRGVPHNLTVYYTDANGDLVKDNTVVTWTGFPEQWLTFTGPTGGNTSTTTNGQATMTVTAAIDAPIGTAVITTSAFNATTRS
ncbi:Ig-like domain-containing protein, partial [Brucella endophytica]|uniref:Ig-like domain-containing protein n=1 Tax=Brucella endophytica TaxID=1963359 RepID=UPI001AEF1889